MYFALTARVSTTPTPTDEQAQGLYQLSYRLTNAIYLGLQFKRIDLACRDEHTKNLYVLAGDGLDFEVKPSGGYEP